MRLALGHCILHGERSLRNLKFLVIRAVLPKPRSFHHGPPTSIPHIYGQQSTTLGEALVDSDTPNLFIRLENELLDQDPKHHVEVLNGQSSCNRRPITNTDIISTYLAVRQSPSSIPDLRAEAYARISKQAEIEGLPRVMDALAADVLLYFPRESDPKGFSGSITSILSYATSQCRLSHQRILQLYEALLISNNATPPPLDPDVVQRIVGAALTRPDVSIPPLEALGAALLSWEPATEEMHAKSTQLAYELTMKIVMEGEASYSRALRLFEDLVKANRIPKEAQTRAEVPGGSFQTVITSVLVQACLWFEWHEKAGDLLMEILRNPRWPCAKGVTETDVKAIADLAFEVLRSLLPSTCEHKVEASRAMIIALLPIVSGDSRPPLPEIPTDILFAFYDSCFTCRLAAPAAHVYRHLQSPQIRQHHDYPPPSRAALPWLLDHFASPGISRDEEQRQDLEGHLYLARSIFNDILRQKHPVTPRDRARLVALAATAGFGMYARRLWETYTIQHDRNRDVVRGNAHMLVPLVRLFVSLQERWDSKQGGELMDARAKESKKGDETDTSFLPRDYFLFAERVLASYIETKVPLAAASQYDLNALARAQLLLGHLPEGMRTLSLIVERGDPPQIADINVLLATVARYSPARAAQMIQHMLERGVQPSDSTFAAVLHEALSAKNTKIVKKLISLAHKSGYGSLTHKGLASLVRSAMEFEYTEDKRERLEQQSKVRWAMDVVETVMRYRTKGKNNPSNHVKSHAISVSVGIECVKGSLKAMEPEMAFQFWRLLMKDRMLWDDREHKGLRAWIARSIRYRWRMQHLRTNAAAVILEELRVPGVEADGPGVGRSSA